MVEHMIQEGDAGFGVALAGAVDVESDGDVGFFGGAGDGGGAGGEFEIGGWVGFGLHDYLWDVGSAPAALSWMELRHQAPIGW